MLSSALRFARTRLARSWAASVLFAVVMAAMTAASASALAAVTDDLPVPPPLAPPPANDAFAAAQDLGGGLTFDVAGTTDGATLEPGEDGYFNNPADGESVWFRWTAPKTVRMWIDNCSATPFGTGLAMYKGDSLGSLSRVGLDSAFTPESPGAEYCEQIYNPSSGRTTGGVSAFTATAGTTYRIQVSNDNNNTGNPFRLGMREARFDGSISQTSSRKSIRKGRTVTYSITLKNLGSLPMTPEVDLTTSKPHRLAQPVVGSRYVSLKITQGSCKRVTFFAVHPGAICDPGKMAAGVTVKITAKVRPSGSLSHWVGLDYAHGGENVQPDDNPRNDPFSAVTTIVKKAHHK